MIVLCVDATCRAPIGEVGRSMLEAKRGQVVWHIQPGWAFRQGTLQQDDFTYRMERQLLHEATGNQRLIEGLGLSRECDLPIRVRCPKCRRVQLVTRDVVFRRVS